MKDHGLLPQPESQQLLHKVKSCFNPPRSSLNHEFFPGKPTSREMEPYLPCEYTAAGADPHLHSAPGLLCSSQPRLLQGLGPQSPFVLVLNATHLQWAQNTSKVPRAWPQPHSLRAWLATTGRACMDAYLDPRLVCEPSFFLFLNSQEAFLQLQVPCDSTEWEMHHLYPALAQPRQECYLQKEPLLCSCTGSNTEYQPLCPCHHFLKGQVALCQGCCEVVGAPAPRLPLQEKAPADPSWRCTCDWSFLPRPRSGQRSAKHHPGEGSTSKSRELRGG
ncbi:Alpha-1,6-mannosylglycoprotein 6-beta-N-acetylglucosaminyltransferase B [Sciurus carolinensis]|uniref:alpha-1,6-mannosyl-glycoprotein 6-beta-N-acetylglucosaminyltransferase n=1 Tax=Sciurus carolinensis TaxID=30640 RepID=A0AA41N4V9_SCICA|nr:Alpha-1,6-mannosylglycoprotein 6-beta-N-acetylglucosaminyltransferase B [Sciurus carolinensis]